MLTDPMYRIVLTGLIIAAGSTAPAEPLRYRIEPKKVVPYNVTITADTPSSTETMKGVIAYTGKQVEGQTITVEFSGGLTKSVKSKARRSGPFRGRGGFGFRPGGPPIPRGPFDQPDFRGLVQSKSTLVLTQTGGVESMRGDSQLPYLLGNLSLLPFDTLPAKEASQWQDGSGLTITSRSSSSSRFGPRFGPFADNDKETTKTGGGETATYNVQSDNQKLVTIAKTYSLSSPSATSGDTAYDMKGSGTWVFNRELGVSESMNFKADLNVRSKNTNVKIPLTIAWNRMSDDDYAAHVKAKQDRIAALQKQAADRRAKQAAAAKEREGKPLESKVKAQVMGDLNSSKWPTIANRLRRMSGFKPHPSDFDVALRVKELRKHKVIGVSMPAKKLWEKLEPILEAAGPQTASAGGGNPFTAEDEKNTADGREMRQWSDNTGSFRVEAQFVKIDGISVVLKRKSDGKEMKVPITRLSAADRKIVESLKAPAKAKNPFE